jgi:hypothetical protein
MGSMPVRIGSGLACSKTCLFSQALVLDLVQRVVIPRQASYAQREIENQPDIDQYRKEVHIR